MYHDVIVLRYACEGIQNALDKGLIKGIYSTQLEKGKADLKPRVFAELDKVFPEEIREFSRESRSSFLVNFMDIPQGALLFFHEWRESRGALVKQMTWWMAEELYWPRAEDLGGIKIDLSSIEAFCPCCGELLDVPVEDWELGESRIPCPKCGAKIHFTIEATYE